MCRIGIGVVAPAVGPLALFVPSPLPSVTCSPSECGDHVHLAAGWALAALGHRCRGGHVVLISDPSVTAWTECLATVMAVDDAAAGGHRPSGPGAGLLDRILHDPRQAAELVAAVHL
jgi:hypothetical protein